MLSERWEHCELALYQTKEKRGKWYYSLLLSYLGEGNITHKWLARIEGDKAVPFPYNAFFRAVAYLGMAEWEMVSVQYGLTGTHGHMDGIHWNQKVAYFKRKVKEGRKTDEPSFELPAD